eukprot:scaffold3999_cov196-Ochromonas_danica.AAC.8
MAIGEDLDLITFDGDQTLYSDGGNFDAENDELALGIINLLINNVKVAVITAAGYGLDGSKYEIRLAGLLERFVQEDMEASQIENFYVFGGECNYLLRAKLIQISDHQPPQPPHSHTQHETTTTTTATNGNDNNNNISNWKVKLFPVPIEEWQGEHIPAGPKPYTWPSDQIKALLDIAEESMQDTIKELKLRARILRKDRAIGVFPGGSDMIRVYPEGHGSTKLKREALDELVLRIMDRVRERGAGIDLPYCVFNGGSDAWLDVGNKSVAVAALQHYLQIPSGHCLHVGDQFLNVGNDIAARENCPCIWIVNPRETGKILHHVLKYRKIAVYSLIAGQSTKTVANTSMKFNIYTGEPTNY